MLLILLDIVNHVSVSTGRNKLWVKRANNMNESARIVIMFVNRMVTGHFGHKTLRHQDTLGHFGTDLKTLRHQKRDTRHFDTSAVIEEKPGHFDPGQFR